MRPLASMIAAVVIAALCVPVVQRVTVMALESPPPAQVTSFEMSVDADGCTVVARLMVSNTTSRGEYGAAWWDLSAPNAQPAWLHPRYQSTVRSFTVPTGSSATLSWNEVAPVATGSYDATYWVHVGPPGRSGLIHSDGGSMGSLLIAPTATGCGQPGLS